MYFAKLLKMAKHYFTVIGKEKIGLLCSIPLEYYKKNGMEKIGIMKGRTCHHCQIVLLAPLSKNYEMGT